MILRELVTKLSFDADNGAVKRFDQNIGLLKHSLNSTTTNMKAMANGIRNAGASLTAFATLPLGLLAGGLIKASSDAVEAESKFGVVFSGIRAEADATAKNLHDNFGLSTRASHELLSATGDILSGFGFSQEQTLQYSKSLNELAVDLTSFKNFKGGVEGASNALTKALIGEKESLKGLGIAILDEDVNAQVALNTSKGMIHATERQAKAYATLQLIQDRAKNSVGDFARTSKEFANQWRILKARVNDLAVEFGRILLPTAKKVIGVVVKLMKKFSGLTDNTKKMIVFIGILVASLGPLLLVFGVVAGAIVSLIGLFGLLNLSMLPIVLIIGFLVGALALLAEDIYVWTQGGDSLIGSVLGGFIEFHRKIGPIIDLLKDTFKNFWKGVIKGDQEGLDKFKENIKELAPIIVKATAKIAEVMFTLFSTIALTLGGMVSRFIFAIIAGIHEKITDFFVGFIDKLKTKFPSLSKYLIGSDGTTVNGAQPTGFANTAIPTLGGFVTPNRGVTQSNSYKVDVNVPAGTTPAEAEKIADLVSKEMGKFSDDIVSSIQKVE